MQWYEILIIVLAAAFVVGVIAWRILRRAQGKGGCDCGTCSGACSCCAGKTKCKAESGDPESNQPHH